MKAQRKNEATREGFLEEVTFDLSSEGTYQVPGETVPWSVEDGL
jgi:hypothetical protein